MKQYKLGLKYDHQLIGENKPTLDLLKKQVEHGLLSGCFTEPGWGRIPHDFNVIAIDELKDPSNQDKVFEVTIETVVDHPYGIVSTSGTRAADLMLVLCHEPPAPNRYNIRILSELSYGGLLEGEDMSVFNELVSRVGIAPCEAFFDNQTKQLITYWDNQPHHYSMNDNAWKPYNGIISDDRVSVWH